MVITLSHTTLDATRKITCDTSWVEFIFCQHKKNVYEMSIFLKE